MATEENVNPTEGQEQENDYRETLLVRNPDSGQVEAVSKLVTKGDRREVHTVQPLAKNRPAFYPFRSSNAVAAFIRGFKSQKDNPIQFQFLKVPVLSVGKIVTSLGKLVSNPKSEEGWETYNKYVVNTAELEQVKYDKVEIPRAELQELGIDFDALPQRTQRSLMLGLPTRELFPATVQLSDHGTTTGLFNLSFYRDHNDELKFRLDTPLVQPEYEREEYASEITPDDKALLARGKTLHDGNWHTVAISFLPSLNYVNDNVRIAVDGTDLNYASNTWGSSWKAGFNQGAGADYNLLQIGGGSYVGVNNNDYASANFNGKIDFITVIDKAYRMDDLKSISYEQVSSVTAKLNAMRQSGTGKTWLFTGGTEAVADFKNSSTIRNWIGLFEDTMRSGGSYIERGRFVFNTARRGSDVASILADYDKQIDAYHTEAVAISVGAEDYSKGQAGLDTFKENLKKLVDKINASRKLAVVITPYPSKDPVQNTNIALYKAAIDAVVSEDAKIVDFSSIAVSNINDDGTLTLEGHQAAANLLKNALGFGST